MTAPRCGPVENGDGETRGFASNQSKEIDAAALETFSVFTLLKHIRLLKFNFNTSVYTIKHLQDH